MSVSRVVNAGHNFTGGELILREGTYYDVIHVNGDAVSIRVVNGNAVFTHPQEYLRRQFHLCRNPRG